MHNQFNPAPPTLMHIDLNSCFATVEQQANPLLRGKPVVVAAYTTERGCILAASVEAKRLGVKTGMRVGDGIQLIPNLVVLPSDPAKYRFVNRKLLALLEQYSADVEVKSIDEMVLRVTPVRPPLLKLAQEIKQRIKTEIGEWLTVSIGIAPNRYLAKLASTIHKPDGLDVIDKENIEKVLAGLRLEDLCGIKQGYGARLRRYGITSAITFYHASPKLLTRALASRIGYDWWLRLHGWEASHNWEFGTKSIGHSYALYKPYEPTDTRLHQILSQLVEKMGKRLRDGSYQTQGIHVSCLFTDYTSWNHGEKLTEPLYASVDLYKKALYLLLQAPVKPVRLLAVTSYFLTEDLYRQESLLSEEQKKKNLVRALDALDTRWGDFTVFPARMLDMEHKVQDRIAFGGVRSLTRSTIYHDG